MTTFLTHLDNILAIDWKTILVIASLCGIAAYFVKEFLAIPPMIIFVFPVMVFCGMVAYYLFLFTEQFNAKRLDQWLMWTILASICGTVVGIGVVTTMSALRERIGYKSPEPPKPTRVLR